MQRVNRKCCILQHVFNYDTSRNNKGGPEIARASLSDPPCNAEALASDRSGCLLLVPEGTSRIESARLVRLKPLFAWVLPQSRPRSSLKPAPISRKPTLFVPQRTDLHANAVPNEKNATARTATIPVAKSRPQNRCGNMGHGARDNTCQANHKQIPQKKLLLQDHDGRRSQQRL